MKYLKQLFNFFVGGLLLFVLFYGFTEGYYSLFIFPLLFLTIFLGYYLHKQMAKDEVLRVENGVKLTVDDVAASKWIDHTLAPDTLSLIRRKHWTVILYSFLLVAIGSFGWSYLSFGLLIAIRNFSYGMFIFWLFIAYALFAPKGIDLLITFIAKLLPEGGRLRAFSSDDKEREMRKYFGDWERAYFFLLPISFVIYLLYPFADGWKEVVSKFFNLPVFFLIYSFLFLALYSLIYIYEDIQKEEEKRMEREIKKRLSE